MPTARTLLALAIPLFCACGGPRPTEQARASTAAPAPPAVRNVILVIGDGMGPAQLGLLEAWAEHGTASHFDGPTAFERLADAGVVGLSRTEPAGALVVDSACSATQLATGVPAPSEALGVDVDGRAVQTVLERAQATGRAVGLVSDTRITHATPAAFAAHLPHRSDENAIAEQLVAAGVDVMLSGGQRYFAPASVTNDGPVRDAWLAQLDGAYAPASRRDDERDLVAEARAAGYAIAFDRASLQAAVDADAPVLGLFAASGMSDAIALDAMLDDPARREPDLAEMAMAAVQVLERDPDGFFLMVEAGQIDWAGHANDAGWMLHEMIRAERAVDALLGYALQHDDTLLVVTADHETGGFGFSYSGASMPTPRTIPGGVFESTPYAPNFDFVGYGTLDVLAAQQAALEGVLAALQADGASAAEVAQVLTRVTGVPLTEADAAAILADAPNAMQVEGHPYLAGDTLPAICDFDAFYVYPSAVRAALLARATAAHTGVVWSTGTHTASPVPIFALGPGTSAAAFGGFTDHVSIGRALIDAIDPSTP